MLIFTFAIMYVAYLALVTFKVGKLAESINDFQHKIEFKSCLRYKSMVECKKEFDN
jgi:hypothetical protein